MFERSKAWAPLQSQSVAPQVWNSEIPLCWLPNVTKLRTGGKLHLSIYPRRNCPPWLNPKASTAGAVDRMGCAARSAQTFSICSVRLPKNVADLSADASSSRRIM